MPDARGEGKGKFTADTDGAQQIFNKISTGSQTTDGTQVRIANGQIFSQCKQLQEISGRGEY